MMEDEQFNNFVNEAKLALEQKNERLMREFGLGHYASFWLDLEFGTLTFNDEFGQARAVAHITPPGTFFHVAGTWAWSWANPSLPGRVREQALPLRGLFDLTGMDIFHQEAFIADAEMPWELVAMAVMFLRRQGAYRIPGMERDLYVTLDSVSHVAEAH